jgi:peptide/nickel transport system substrate-binding protein
MQQGKDWKMINRQTLIAACLLASTLIAGAAAAQTLRIGLSSDPDTLDPTLSRIFPSVIVRTALCDKLLDIGLELEIVPQLATEWYWTDDRKGLVIKLLSGVRVPRWRTPRRSYRQYNIESLLMMPGSTRKRDIGTITGVEVIEDHTAKLVLSAPFAPLLAQLAAVAGTMISPKAAQAAGENLGSHPVCAGRFKFVERDTQDRIVVERFSDYWDKDKIKLDRIIFLPIPAQTVRLANLQSGSLDLSEVAATDLDSVRKDPRLKLAAVTGMGYQGIAISVANS